MSKLTHILSALACIGAAAIVGLSVWLFRQTNFVATVALDGLPLAQDSGATNLAILGVGGEGHEGGDLTDTIFLVSLRHQDFAVRLLAIPRDVWIDPLKIKINAAYYYGKQQNIEDGLSLAREAMSQTLGIPIHYVAIIDFSGFIKLVDVVGGVDVVVARTFDDYKYPIPGQENAEPESARYEHLHFNAGPAHFDGTTALKYARSRHALGEEGTDFARSARQQQIITALKDKILTSSTLLNYNTLTQIIQSLSSSITTDLTPNYYRSIFSFALNFKQADAPLTTGSLTPYLENPKNLTPYGGAWVLLARPGLKEYVTQFLAQ